MRVFSASHPRPRWYAEAGYDYDVIVSSKVKISRNLSSFAYPHLLDEKALEEAGAKIAAALSECCAFRGFKDILRYDLQDLSAPERNLLAEEGRIHRGEDFRRASLLVSGSGRMCVEVNAKDHLCISSSRGGSSLWEAWHNVDKVDSELEVRLDYAVSLELGYLSAELGSLGTGMEASLVLHLPGVSLSGRLDKVEKILGETGFTMESFLPVKGSGAEFFLITGRPRAGEPEESLLKKFDEITVSLVNYEREMRNLLFEKKGDFLEDQMSRAFGILGHAKFLGLDEAVKLLSLLRMGYCPQREASANWEAVTELIFRSLPAHIRARLDGETPDTPEEKESRERAVFIHEELKKTSWGEEANCV